MVSRVQLKLACTESVLRYVLHACVDECSSWLTMSGPVDRSKKSYYIIDTAHIHCMYIQTFFMTAKAFTLLSTSVYCRACCLAHRVCALQHRTSPRFWNLPASSPSSYGRLNAWPVMSATRPVTRSPISWAAPLTPVCACVNSSDTCPCTCIHY